MRVGLVIYGSLNTVSGGYLYDRMLVAYLRRAGDTVEIITLPWRNYARHLSDNFSVDCLRRLRDARVEVLLQDELNHPSLFLINRRVRARYPIWSIVHHLRSSEAHLAWANFFYRVIECAYLAGVDGLIVNSETTRQTISDLLGQPGLAPSIVAYPGGNRFNSQISTAQIVARTHATLPLKILFIGNLIPRKNLHVLLAALARLPDAEWELTIVGNLRADEHYARAIQQQIQTQRLANVRLRGALPDRELASVLAQSNVLAVPSDYEGFGIVYLEAMSFGVPPIATTSGAARELITDGVNGLLVPPNDAAALAARLLALCTDRERLAQMSLAARARFLVHPTWDESMAKIRTRLIELTQ